MKVGVTGGAGYIGSTLIRDLTNDGNQVISFDNESIGNYYNIKKYLKDEDVTLYKGDIRDRDKLLSVFEDVEAVAHLAALPGLDRCRKSPEEAVSVNVFGTYQVLEACRILGIEKVIFCSSAGVYGKPQKLPVDEDDPLNPLNLYGVTKEAGEKLVNAYHLNHGMNTVNLRFGNIYGVGVYTRWDTVIPKFVKQGLEGKPLTVYGDGEQSRDFVHVEDITKSIILSLERSIKGEHTFNVGGETLSINALSQIIRRCMEDETKTKVIVSNSPPRVGETKEFSYDVSRIKNKLGFQNNWNIKGGVLQLIKHFQADELVKDI
jgi:UDP-glucose 4-epimerase